MRDVSPVAVYAGFCVLVVFAGSVGLAVAHVVKVARKVRQIIAEATDSSPVDPVDAQLDTNPVEPLLTHGVRDEEESNETAADFVLWANELDGDPGIRKYSRRMDRWSR